MKRMFHAISPRYDFITRVFSYGMDPGWKRQAIERAGLAPDLQHAPAVAPGRH